MLLWKTLHCSMGEHVQKFFSSLCFLGWLCQKKSERVWEGCGEMEPLCVASGNVK